MLKLTAKFLIVVLFMAMIFAPSTAEALRQATLTPSPTFIPPSVTPTYYSYACPVGTPLGWGTYTPSPLWLSTCNSCPSLPTSTAAATFTPSMLTMTALYQTGTPTRTATATIIPSVTATATNTGSGFITLSSG